VVFDDCAWVGTGIVPVATLQFASTNFVIQDGPVATVEMYSVEWPTQLKDHLRARLMEKAFGPRYLQSGPRRRVLNGQFWADFLVKQMGLFYQLPQEVFWMCKTDGGGAEKVTIERLMVASAHHLRVAATRDPTGFPAGEIRFPRIKKLIEEMKVIAAGHTPEELDALDTFLVDCVEQRSRSYATVSELCQRYAEYCCAKGLQSLPQSIFERRLPAMVREQFGVAKSHDLRRPKGDGALKWQRGFRGLAFREKTEGAKKADGADALDGADGLAKKPDQASSDTADQIQQINTPPPNSAAQDTPGHQPPA
jgi:hypothetical protein